MVRLSEENIARLRNGWGLSFNLDDPVNISGLNAKAGEWSAAKADYKLLWQLRNGHEFQELASDSRVPVMLYHKDGVTDIMPNIASVEIKHKKKNLLLSAMKPGDEISLDTLISPKSKTSSFAKAETICKVSISHHGLVKLTQIILWEVFIIEPPEAITS